MLHEPVCFRRKRRVADGGRRIAPSFSIQHFFNRNQSCQLSTRNKFALLEKPVFKKRYIYIYILTMLPPLIIVYRAVSFTKRRKKKKEEVDGINYRQIDYGWAF